MTDEMTSAEFRALRFDIDTPKRRNKFNARVVDYDGYHFASQAERDYYIILKAREDEGAISHLRVHTVWEIVPAFDYLGKHYKPLHYVSDFDYTDLESEGMQTIIDVKGGKATQTPLFRLKWRLMQARYSSWFLSIVEVT